MVESKFVVLQMIPHSLFIEWDFGYYSWYCSLAVLLFMTLLLVVLLYTSSWHCSLAVVKFTVHIYGIVHVYGTVHIYGTIHTTSFFFKCSFLDLFNLKFYA